MTHKHTWTTSEEVSAALFSFLLIWGCIALSFAAWSDGSSRTVSTTEEKTVSTTEKKDDGSTVTTTIRTLKV